MGRSGEIILIAAVILAISGCTQQVETVPEPRAEAEAPAVSETAVPEPAPADPDGTPAPRTGESYEDLLPDGM